MTPDMELLSNYREFEKPEKVSLGDGRTVNAIGVGDIHVKMEFRVSEQKYLPGVACPKTCLQPVFGESFCS